MLRLRPSLLLTISSFLLMLSGFATAQQPHTQQACAFIDHDIPFLERVDITPIILEGRVTDVFTYFEYQPEQQVATIEVLTYFKGNGPATITVADWSNDRESCKQSVQIGGPYIFFVYNDLGVYRAYYAGSEYGYFAAERSVRDEIIQIIGANPSTPDPDLQPSFGAYNTAEWAAENIFYDAPPTSSVYATATAIAVNFIMTQQAETHVWEMTNIPPTSSPPPTITLTPQEAPSQTSTDFDRDYTDLIFTTGFMIGLILQIALQIVLS